MLINWKIRVLGIFFFFLYGLICMARYEAPGLTRLAPVFFDNAPNFMAAWLVFIGLLSQSGTRSPAWLSKTGLTLDPYTADPRATASRLGGIAAATAIFLVAYEFYQKYDFLHRQRTFDPLDIAATVVGALSCAVFAGYAHRRGKLWSSAKDPEGLITLAYLGAMAGALLFVFYNVFIIHNS
jgi:hypothetical protein